MSSESKPIITQKWDKYFDSGQGARRHIPQPGEGEGWEGFPEDVTSELNPEAQVIGWFLRY